ncbi:MAG: Tyrosine recombinase XerC [Syntrophorhabdaceae bacterium PtaU1.Bin034]|nr:MAG: Tyrosine recombinase XerC [Syntrophorhabdaceae bacterium PtaU1.Bin034]
MVKSKNREKRGIPMSNTLQGVLQSIKVRHISGRVFPIAIRSLRAAFGQTLAKARIENFHFHNLRHTFATRLVQNGVDLYKVKELLGHKTLAMTTRYAHHYPESLRGGETHWTNNSICRILPGRKPGPGNARTISEKVPLTGSSEGIATILLQFAVPRLTCSQKT